MLRHKDLKLSLNLVYTFPVVFMCLTLKYVLEPSTAVPKQYQGSQQDGKQPGREGK